ncbi:hypothetical protein LRS73_32295 (plasmid) [Methylobacterium currus]|uniref:hypothetical protein n=1 Tax=Methylobacterium currus TaxID=2051553 RepID=UPI001E636170|nr:hypothetical protein [Methylobacterium currus]UHC20048.1 hypothetical protein LRS73_32295 [Methylobacterium currus]
MGTARAGLAAMIGAGPWTAGSALAAEPVQITMGSNPPDAPARKDSPPLRPAGPEGLAVRVAAAHGAPPAVAGSPAIFGPSGAIRLAGGDLTMTGFVDRLADGARFETCDRMAGREGAR